MRLSRAAGYRQANLELLSIDESFRAISFDTTDYNASDFNRARQFASNFAKFWLKNAIATDSPVRESVRTANQATLNRLELIAVTESSIAFNAGRNSATARYRGDYDLVRVWDATLDKRLCSTCESSDGEIAPISQKFSLGEPGVVHPSCRCTYYITTNSIEE